MATTKAPTGTTGAREDEGRELGAGAREAAGTVASGIAAAADTVSARLPDAAAATRGAVDEAARRLATGTDTELAVGASFSTGLAVGLLVGGAARILVALALIPAAAMSMTLVDRASARGRRAGAA